MGAMLAYLRGLGARRVVVVGASRGTLSIANGVSRLKGAGAYRPDAQELTSGFWKFGSAAEGFTVWEAFRVGQCPIDESSVAVGLAQGRQLRLHVAGRYPCLHALARGRRHESG